MKRFCAIALLLMPFIFVKGQKQGSVWVFPNSNKLDFNSNPPTFQAGGALDCSGATFCEGVASISDSIGNLLFYSDGTKVWDANDEVAINGGGLLGHRSSTNAAYIVPIPGSDTRYYLFTTDAYENELENGLRYSVIEVCGGGTNVLEKNILLRSNVTEKLSAVHKTNSVDYWLVAHEHGTDRFLTYSITSSGIELTDSSSIGSQHPIAFNGAVGQMKFSPTRDKLVLAVSNNGMNPFIEILDFANGVLSNPISFSPDTLYSGQSEILMSCYGISFSPNGQLLYVSPVYDSKLIQLNVEHYTSAIDILATKKVLSIQPNSGQAFHQIQLGPDGKIYLASWGESYLGLVNAPNEIGAGSNFEIQGVHLNGNTSGWGLPSFIDSYDYTISGICDTGVGIAEHSKEGVVEIYPNPTTGEVHLKLPNGVLSKGIELYDMLGKRVMGLPYQPTIDVSGLPKGNYIIAMHTEERTYRQLLVVE